MKRFIKCYCTFGFVTPLAGVWIETTPVWMRERRGAVTPLAGVRIAARNCMRTLTIGMRFFSDSTAHELFCIRKEPYLLLSMMLPLPS